MPRKPAKESVKAAADRAEKRAKGESIETPITPIDPVISKATLSEEDKEELDSPNIIRVGSILGRPTKYDPKLCESVGVLAAGGATDGEIADALKINAATLYRWKAAYPEFSMALQAGKDACDERVERSLFARAVGYTYDTIKIMQHEGVPVIVAHKEHMAPDVGAAKHWLHNRRGKYWKEAVHRVETGNPGDFDSMSDEELTEHVEKQYKEIAQLKKGRGSSSKTEH